MVVCFATSVLDSDVIREVCLYSLKKKNGDFPGGPVVKTPHFPCRDHGFDPWLGS